jgi:hypothetical protein
MPDASGINPSISLGVAPPGGGAAPVNPLAAISTLSEVQNRLNQNKLFQQQFQANQAIGQIFATERDPEVAIQKIMNSPWASFAMPAIANYRQAASTQRDIAGKRTEQNQTALQSYLKNSAAAANDPSLLPGIADRSIAGLDPIIRNDAAPLIRSASAATMQGVDLKTPEGMKKYQSNLLGQMTASGITPDVAYSLMGMTPPAIRDVTTDLGQTQPVQTGGLKGNVATPLTMEQGGAATPSANALGVAAPSAAAPPSAPIASPTLAGKEYTTKRVGDMAQYEQRLDDSVVSGASQRRQIDEMMVAAKEAQFGAGAELRMKFAQAMQALGINNSEVDKMANGSLPATQVADKIALTNVLSQARQRLQGNRGSRLNMQEFTQLVSKNPSVTTDPRAMLQIFNLWNDFYDRNVAEQQGLDEYKSKGGDITRWPTVWANSDYMKKFAPKERISGEGMKGVPQTGEPKATHFWVPGKGAVPVEEGK